MLEKWQGFNVYSEGCYTDARIWTLKKKEMENLIKRKNQFRLIISIYLIVILIGTLFSFITSYFVENLDTSQAIKIFILPVLVLFIAVNFMFLIFFMDFSKFKFENIPTWWFLFYISLFIPYFNYFIPLILFFIFLGKNIDKKNKVIFGLLNFIPFFAEKIIQKIIYKVVENYITDKILLMDLNFFLQQTIKWIIIYIIINRLVNLENNKKEFLEQ